MYMWLLKIQSFNFAFAPSADLHLHVIVNVPGEAPQKQNVLKSQGKVSTTSRTVKR